MPPMVRRLLLVAVVIGVLVWLEVGPTPAGGPGFTWILGDAAWRQLVLFAMVNVVIALSLNVINGMAGQFSIGHAGFVGIGAYTGAIVAGQLHVALGSGDPQFKNSFLVVPLVLLASGTLAALFGLLVGLPSLRLRGDYLAIVTLGFAEIFRLVIATAQTGGTAEGPVSRFLASLGGQNGYAGPEGTGVPQYSGAFWIFGAVIVATLIAWRLKFSGWGRALRALREDEIAASAVGVDPTRYKVTSFVIAAAGAGVAGGLFATMQDGSPTVQPDSFTFTQSFDAITMVILGGSGSVSGAIVGGVFVTVTVKLIEQLQGIDSVQAFRAAHPSLDLNALRMVVYAAVLIGLMILRPEGLFGERELSARRLFGALFRKKTLTKDEAAAFTSKDEAADAAAPSKDEAASTDEASTDEASTDTAGGALTKTPDPADEMRTPEEKALAAAQKDDKEGTS